VDLIGVSAIKMVSAKLSRGRSSSTFAAQRREIVVYDGGDK
jgi:hypothetical protein